MLEWHKNLWGSTARTVLTQMAKGIFLTKGHHAQCISWGWPGAAAQGLAGHWGAIASCPLYILISIIVTVILMIIFFLICPIKLFLSQPVSFLTFSFLILSPIPLLVGSWGSGCVVFSCQLGLNQSSYFLMCYVFFYLFLLVCNSGSWSCQYLCSFISSIKLLSSNKECGASTSVYLFVFLT